MVELKGRVAGGGGLRRGGPGDLALEGAPLLRERGAPIARAPNFLLSQPGNPHIPSSPCSHTSEFDLHNFIT